jgi:hypothetical protein
VIDPSTHRLLAGAMSTLRRAGGQSSMPHAAYFSERGYF